MNWFKKIFNILFSKKKTFETNLDYWQDRSMKFGARSVINMEHKETIEEITQFQINEIFPKLTDHLNGEERVVLDFGCGPGRFTIPLAELINGRAIGVDPIQSLIDLAPESSMVSYKLIPEGKIPVADNSVDLVWICLVLGGIVESDLPAIAEEIKRVLKPGGLLCLIENTADKKSIDYWYFRSVEFYQQILPFGNLKKAHHYVDLNQEITVMIGRSSDETK